jgi:small subunit ribosomal protein S6
MIREYETTFIVDSLLQEDQINATIERTKSFIEKNGGKIKHIDRWGKRRLAYEIAKKQYGYYIYMRFQSEGSLIKDLEHNYKLDDAILRHLTVLVPKAMLKQEEKQKSSSKKREQEKETENNDTAVKQSSDKNDKNTEETRTE